MRLIDEIPDYKRLLLTLNDEKKALKKQKRAIASIKRKIEKLNRRYQFIERIFSPGSEGANVEGNVSLLFQAIGYENVRHITHNTRNPDLEIEYDGELTYVEVKSSQNPHLRENEIFQILKYRNRKQGDLPNVKVKGLLVFNHQNKEPDPTKRNPTPFDQFRERDAKFGNYSLVSTVELLKAFVLVKTGRLTLEQFHKMLHVPGIVKFSNGERKKALGEP